MAILVVSSFYNPHAKPISAYEINNEITKIVPRPKPKRSPITLVMV